MWESWDASGAWVAPSAQLVVALTGTGSLLSGLLLVLEWWWSRQFGASLLARLTSRATPWLGAPPGAPAPPNQRGCTCEVYPNPLALLRGAEYRRLREASGRDPLSYYDMNLTAQEHQAWFGGGGASGAVGAALAHMAAAWRAREPAARVAAARAALARLPSCAPALLLLAEEDAPDVEEAERLARRAWRCAEAAERAAAAAGDLDGQRRSAALSSAARRRVAACWRRRGRLRDAVRLLRAPPPPLPALHPAPPAPAHHTLARDMLLEILLEQRAYCDVEALVARCLEAGSQSTAVLWAAALVRLRAGGAAAGAAAVAAAVRANPHVPRLLLELEPLRAPPEHAARGGLSEALCYAAAHLPHWRRSGALRALPAALPRAPPPPPACRAAACADRALLPPAPAPARAAPALLAAAAAAAAALLAALLWRWY